MPAKNTKHNKSGMKPRRGKDGRKRGIPLNPTIWPVTQTHVLAFADRRQLTEPALLGGANYTYSLNGLFDPNITGVGGQPVGFDPIMVMFLAYRVIETRFEITAANRTANSFAFGYSINQTNALPNNPSAWLVDPKSTCVQVGSVAGNRGMVKIDRTVRPWEQLGIPMIQYRSNREYTGSALANPSIQPYLIVWGTGNTAVADFDIIIRLSYRVEFLNPILQALS